MLRIGFVRDFLIRYLVAGLIFAAIDAVWLTVVANRFYKRHLGDLLLSKPNLVAAVLFYLIYIAGVVVFALTPALDRQSWLLALGYGALLGLFAYATYDLTNLATLKGFPLIVVIVDIVWGVALTGGVTALAYAFLHR